MCLFSCTGCSHRIPTRVVRAPSQDSRHSDISTHIPKLLSAALLLLEPTRRSREDTLVVSGVIRLIGTLFHTPSSRSLCYENDAVRKILPFLQSPHPEVSHQVLLTLNRMLGVQQSGFSETGNEEFSIGAYTRDKLTGVFSSMRRVLERRVFSRDGSETQSEPYFPDRSEASSDHASSIHDSALEGEGDNTGGWAMFPPSKEVLQELTSHLQGTRDNDDDESSGDSTAAMGDTKQGRAPPTSATASSSSPISSTENFRSRSAVHDDLKPLAAEHGIIQALIASIKDPSLSLALKIQILHTVSNTIHVLKDAHLEMVHESGYKALVNIFDTCDQVDDTNSEVFAKNTKEVFDIIFGMIFDGSTSRLVANVDALDALVHIIEEGPSKAVQVVALQCLLDVLSSNPVNVVFAKHVDMPQVLLKLFQECCELPEDAMVPDDVACSASTLQNLLYSACLLAPVSQEVFEGLTAILGKPSITRRGKNQVLHAASQVLSDLNARHIGTNADLLRPYLDMVKRFIQDHQPEEPRSRSDSFVQQQMMIARKHFNAAAGDSSPSPLSQSQQSRRSSDLGDLVHDPASSFLAAGSQYRDSVSENCPSVGLSSPSVSSLAEQLHEDSEEIIRLLVIVGSLIEGNLQCISLLHQMDGMTIFADLIASPEVSSDVAQLALWLMQEFIILGARNYDDIKYLDYLLNDPGLRAEIRLMVLRSMAATMADESVGAIIKTQFCACGGLLSVLTICYREMDPEIVAAAFLTVAVSITGCETNKRYLIEKPRVMSELLKASHVEHDVDFFIFLVELFTTGSVTSIFAPKQYTGTTAAARSPSEENILDSHGPDIEELLQTVLVPKSTYSTPLQPSRKIIEPRSSHKSKGGNGEIKVGGRALSHGKGSTASHSEVLSQISDRRSDFGLDVDRTVSSHGSDVSENIASMFENLFQLPTASESEVSIGRTGGSKPPDHSRSGSRAVIDTAQDSVHTSEEKYNEIEAYSPAAFLPQLAAIKFRSGEMAMTILRSLEQVDQEVQLAVLQLLLLLLDATPHNKRAFCQVQGIQHLLNICNRMSEYTVQEGYLRLVASLGAYDLSRSGDASLLFHLALSPPSNASIALDDSFDDLGHATDVSFQIGMLDVLSQIVHTTGPRSYFHFDGRDSLLNLSPTDAIPTAKVGYTLCFWLRIYPLSTDQVVLLSMRDQLSLTHFELGFKMMQGTSSEPRKPYLFVRTRHVPSPPETSIFDTFAFTDENDGESCTNWFFITITHNNDGVALYVDGEFIQRHSLRSYFGDINKTNRLTGSIGREVDHNHNSSVADLTEDGARAIGFCGEVSSLHFVEGVWDEPTVQQVHCQGPLLVEAFKIKGKEAKEFLVIDPRAAVPISHSHDIPSGPSSSAGSDGGRPGAVQEVLVRLIQQGSSAMTDLTKLFGASASNVPGQVPLLSDKRGDNWKQVATLTEGVAVHHTVPLADAVLEEFGIRLCFLFLRGNMDDRLQTRGLQVMLLLLEQSESCLKEFIKYQGYATLLHLMKKSTTLASAENIGMLIDFMCYGPRGSNGGAIIHNLDIFMLVTDLLSSIDIEVQRQVIFQLNDLVCTSRDESARAKNTEAWLLGPGLLRLLELFHELPITLRGQLRGLLEQILSCATIPELRLVTDLLLEKHSQEQPVDLEVKADILETLFHVTVRNPQLLNHLSQVGGYQTLLSLMEIQSEKVRVMAVKVLALYLHISTRTRQTFVRAKGFETLGNLLSFFQLPHSLCKVLLGLAQDVYTPLSHDKCDHGRDKSTDSRQKLLPERTLSGSSDLDDSLRPSSDAPVGKFAADPSGVVASRAADTMDARGSRLIYPQVVFVILNILPSASHDLQVQFLDTLENMVGDAAVADSLLESSWLDWCWSFLSSRTKQGSQNRHGQSPISEDFEIQLYEITTRMILLDLTKPPRTSRVVKLREMWEAESFQLRVVTGLLDHFEQSPRFSQTDPTLELQNLVTLWSHVEDVTGFSPELALRIMNCINLLSYQNDSPVRTMMKNLGMFEIRDNLILFSLRGDLSEQSRFETICNFSFESVAHQPKFRESNGLLYLLKIFHVAVDDLGLQTAIGEILRDVFGTQKENLKVICSILEDKEVISHFFGTATPEMSASRTGTGSPRRGGSSGPGDEPVAGFETFLNWYYHADRKEQRLAVEQRIYNLLMPVAVAQRKKDEKVNQKKDTAKKSREKKQRETMQKQSKKIEGFERSRKAELGQTTGAHSKRMAELVDARTNRALVGRRSWLRTKKFLRDKGVTVPSISEQPIVSSVSVADVVAADSNATTPKSDADSRTDDKIVDSEGSGMD